LLYINAIRHAFDELQKLKPATAEHQLVTFLLKITVRLSYPSFNCYSSSTGSSGLRQPSCPSAAKLGSGKTVNTMVAIFAGRQCLSYHLSISYIFEIVKQELQK
jgi:hypothetical protein